MFAKISKVISNKSYSVSVVVIFLVHFGQLFGDTELSSVVGSLFHHGEVVLDFSVTVINAAHCLFLSQIKIYNFWLIPYYNVLSELSTQIFNYL